MGFIPVKCNPYEIGGEMETGGKVWPGARILQRILLEGPTAGNLDTSFSNPNPVPLNVTPRTVLELGAGTGLVGLALAKCGYGDHVYITDGMAAVAENIENNWRATKKNRRVSEVHTAQYRWSMTGEADDSVHDDGKELYPVDWLKPELIIGSDIVYDRDVIPDLCETLFRLLPCRFGAVIVCEERNEATFTAFRKYLAMIGLAVRDIELRKEDGTFDVLEGGTLLDNGTFRALHINGPDEMDNFLNNPNWVEETT